MRTTVKLRMPYPDTADAGDGVQAYTDLGTGTVDTSKPLLQRGAELFARGLRRFRGAGTEAFGRSVPKTGRALPPAPPGAGSETFGVTPFGVTPSYRQVTVEIPPAFGKHKFSVRLVDEAGNPQGDALPVGEMLISSEQPPSLRTFAFSGYDAGLDRLTFSFERNVE